MGCQVLVVVALLNYALDAHFLPFFGQIIDDGALVVNWGVLGGAIPGVIVVILIWLLRDSLFPQIFCIVWGLLDALTADGVGVVLVVRPTPTEVRKCQHCLVLLLAYYEWVAETGLLFDEFGTDTCCVAAVRSQVLVVHGAKRLIEFRIGGPLNRRTMPTIRRPPLLLDPLFIFKVGHWLKS